MYYSLYSFNTCKKLSSVLLSPFAYYTLYLYSIIILATILLSTAGIRVATKKKHPSLPKSTRLNSWILTNSFQSMRFWPFMNPLLRRNWVHFVWLKITGILGYCNKANLCVCFRIVLYYSFCLYSYCVNGCGIRNYSPYICSPNFL